MSPEDTSAEDPSVRASHVMYDAVKETAQIMRGSDGIITGFYVIAEIYNSDGNKSMLTFGGEGHKGEESPALWTIEGWCRNAIRMSRRGAKRMRRLGGDQD